MNPAPPVTSSLRIADLTKHGAQLLPPVIRHEAGLFDGGLVEHAIRRATRRSGIVGRLDGYYFRQGIEQPDGMCIFSYRDSEVVPARDTPVSPMVQTAGAGRGKQTPCSSGERRRGGWRA